MPRKQFANELAKSCLAVWVDDQAGFGTFPLEAMECETPVIGKMPNLIPEWMEVKDSEGNYSIKNNGVWTNTIINIPELIATYIKVWLEDSVPSEMIDSIKESKGQYTGEKQKEVLSTVYNTMLEGRIAEFKNIISNLEKQAKEASEKTNA